MAGNNELAVVLRLVADQFKGELENSRGAIGKFNDFLKDWRTQLTAAGTALFAVAKSTANYGEEALKTSQRIGTTVEVTTALQHAAHMADVPIGTLEKGLKTLAQSAAQAMSGSGDGAKLFEQLGLSATDASGKIKPLDQLFFELQDRLNQTRSQVQFLDLGTKALGKSFLEMVPLIRQGSEATKAAAEDGKRLGVVLGKEDAEAASKFNDELKRLSAASQGLSLTVGKQLVPAITQLLQSITSLTAGPVGTAFKLEVQGWAAIFTLFNHAIRETGAEIDVFFRKMGKSDAVKKFWNDALVEGRKNLDRETEKRLHQIFQEPLGKVGGQKPDKAGVETGRDVFMGTTVPATKPFDQVKYAKDLIEIWNTGTRALEIQKKIIGEEIDLMFRQEQIADEGRKKRDERNRSELEAGLANAERMLEANEQSERQERDGMVALAQAWMEYDNQIGASTEQRYTHRMDLLRATLTKETELTKEEAGRLLIAWQNHDQQLAQEVLSRTQLTGIERETLERQYLTRLAAVHQEFSGDIFEGWRRGMEQYVRNTDSAFGFAAQMAQRTAQFMEQNFRQFFFDVMDNRIRSLNDLFKSFANFAKQMIAQVMAQLATMLAMKAITGAFGGGFGLGGLFSGFGGGGGGMALAGGADAGGLMGGLKFASGGPVLGAGNSDTVRAMLTPGEGVLNRRGMQALAQLNAGALPTSSEAHNITVNVHNPGRSEQPQVNFRRHLKGVVMDIIWSDPDMRNMLGARA